MTLVSLGAVQVWEARIVRAKDETLAANGFDNAYVRCIAWRGSGPDMGVAAKNNPLRMARTAT